MELAYLQLRLASDGRCIKSFLHYTSKRQNKENFLFFLLLSPCLPFLSFPFPLPFPFLLPLLLPLSSPFTFAFPYFSTIFSVMWDKSLSLLVDRIRWRWLSCKAIARIEKQLKILFASGKCYIWPIGSNMLSHYFLSVFCKIIVKTTQRFF